MPTLYLTYNKIPQPYIKHKTKNQFVKLCLKKFCHSRTECDRAILITYSYLNSAWKNTWETQISIIIIILIDSAAQRGLWPLRHTKFRGHKQRRATVIRTPLGRVISSSQRRLPDNTQNTQQTSMPPVAFQPTIAAETYSLDRAATGTGKN
jgi:hypothetical protein